MIRLKPMRMSSCKVEKIPVKKAIEMAERGELPDAKSLAALFLARAHLEKYI